ncbi:MAG: AAA family ATPase [Deltaproteobacteria bacterium]|nr:AAA family ATPase [Deltaproteobacteria bacterium]
MFSSLYVDNFRCLTNLEIRFGDLSLLVGENGTGKSSVIDILYRLRDLASGRAKAVELFPAADLCHWDQRAVQAFELAADLEDEAFSYRVEIEHDSGRRRSRIIVERVTLGERPLFEFRQGQVQLYRDDYSKGPSYSFDWGSSALSSLLETGSNSKLVKFRKFLSSTLVVRPVPPNMTSFSETEEAILERDGSNFASWFRHFTLEHPSDTFELQKSLQEIWPGFHEWRYSQFSEETRTFRIVRRTPDGRAVDTRFDALSDGERVRLLLYALLAAIRSDNRVLVLDEPENFLGLREIQPWLLEFRDIVTDFEAQGIIASHHPELINYLGRDDGIWMRRDGVGPTRITDEAPTIPEGGVSLADYVIRGWTD